MPNEEQLKGIIEACSGTVIEVYDFYKLSTLDKAFVPKSQETFSIKSNSAYLLQEVMQA